MIFNRKIGNLRNMPPSPIDLGISRLSLAERIIQQQQELLENISISNLTPPFSPLNLHDVDLMAKEEQKRKLIYRTGKEENFNNMEFDNF
jgi:hypothetical protein